MRRRGIGAVLPFIVAVALMMSSCASADPSSGSVPGASAASGGSAPWEPPTAVTVASIAFVGPLFGGSLEGGHGCSASVVHSPGGNLLLTAAHCLSSTGAGMLFAPAYQDGAAPYGTWTVRQVYVDPSWTEQQNPQADYAFLRVAPTAGSGATGAVEDVVGADELGDAPAAGTAVRIDAYAAGINDRPITCLSPVRYEQGFPTFDCEGYVSGTSGGPWIAGVSDAAHPGTVVGVIGGLRQGGCDPATSHSSRFGAQSRAVYSRATQGTSPDRLPRPGIDSC